MSCMPVRMPVAVGVLALTLVVSAPSLSQTYEQAPRLRASEVLSQGLLQGPDYRVREEVANDGVLNIYTIDSSYGTFEAVSTARLRQRIGEIIALRHMQTIRQSDLFVGAIKQAAGGTVDTVKSTLRDPVGTVSGVFSGVGKAFSRTGESVFGSRRSQAEGGQLESLIGLAEAKRKFAYEFGVDVYSDNSVLQDRLDELARATTLGKLSFSAATSMVPGAGGAVLSVTGATQTANQIYRTTAPADLRAMNRQRLAAMQIREDAIAAFMDNAKFSPREQTELVLALQKLTGASQRNLFVHFAALTNDRDMAFFRTRQAQMYAGYHTGGAPIASFVALGEFVAARTKSGVLAFNLPIDHMVWSNWMASAVARIDQVVAAMPGIKEKQVVLTGTLSPMARQELTQKGWKITENAERLVAGR